MLSQDDVIETLPEHLRCFVAHQEYDSYTPRDHALWRFVLRRLLAQLDGIAHPTFFEGLEATGISIDAIPRIEVMNYSMGRYGWRAVVVDGFLPPAIFMEFQAHCVLPIAVDIRSLKHILYTPAPDIIHETVGHAPFIIDIDYAEFLQRVGELGMQAIGSRVDYEIYEAVRHHSILMESPAATGEERSASAEALERTLRQKQQQKRGESEAALLSRLHWWTVEYGLVGDIDNCLIFGAGLLSSLGESRHCLHDPAVAKKLLTVDAIRKDYDITHQQPQLYVTGSCRHLRQVLDEFGRGMCCQRGGAESLRRAIDAETVNTARLDSGIEISGVLSGVTTDAMDNVCYMNTNGPTQLAFDGREIAGHGIDCHPEGYGTALGKIRNITRCLSQFSVDELKLNAIEAGRSVTLNFVSGISVAGRLERIVRQHNRNILFTFSRCEVKDAEGQCLFLPEWGQYDLAVGESVVSVYGGASDKGRYPVYSQPSQQITPHVTDARDQEQFSLYQEIRQCRELSEKNATAVGGAAALCERIAEYSGLDWLLYFEARELSRQCDLPAQVTDGLSRRLNRQLDGCDTALRKLVVEAGQTF